MKLLQGKTGWALLIALALVFPYMVSNTYFLSVICGAICQRISRSISASRTRRNS